MCQPFSPSRSWGRVSVPRNCSPSMNLLTRIPASSSRSTIFSCLVPSLWTCYTEVTTTIKECDARLPSLQGNSGRNQGSGQESRRDHHPCHLFLSGVRLDPGACRPDPYLDLPGLRLDSS